MGWNDWVTHGNLGGARQGQKKKEESISKVSNTTYIDHVHDVALFKIVQN